MRRNNQAAAAEDEAQIDLTPMLDVVFIMLIFFIVTASFIKEAGIEVNRPEASTSQPKENVNILVAINANNEIWMDKRRIDARAVRANIERLHAENPKGAVVIQADNKSNTETVASVLDAAREAGVYDVSLATEEK
ncbi:MAG: biopolymer transporter ExbD [Pseudomonadales bacterium]|jgi:biopolymer transport protein ExbD|nr:biopolymer transporter ExbD [Halieaceae bacterium]MCP5165977.1 biopolymer transporter ExbD [Pseudomonadales bacterium]MCP5187340.1 biopolymer transporter ExbD [Pseudomonadales bacterium]